jgi:hypothetical protein
LGCNAADNQNVSGLDWLAGATELDLDRRRAGCYPDGPINTVDKEQTIHQVVLSGGGQVLRIYSRPIDSCVAFDSRTSAIIGASSRSTVSTARS